MDKNVLELRELIRFLERKLGLLNGNEMQCCSVSMAQCHAIVEIGRENLISLNRLSELLNLDNSTTSRTVNNLVNRNLALRELDPKDRRCIAISLTEEGKKIYEEIESGMTSYYSNIYACIPDNKKNQVMEGLSVLLHAIDESKCCK